jgi:peptide deformylase
MPSQNLSLKYWPDSILRTVCSGSDTTDFLAGEEMIKLMIEKHGMGLAAPQVGLTSRLFVMRDPDDNNKGLIFVNPVITEHSKDTYKDNEGCLSFPGPRVDIERFKWVNVEFDVPLGYTLPVGDDRLTWHFEGIYARCVQHEIDHLNGIMIFDHVKSNLAKKLVLDKYAKLRRRV